MLLLFFYIIEILTKQSAVIFILCRNSELDSMVKTLLNFEDKINRKLKYPYLFLNNEDFTEAFKTAIRSVVKTDVEFGKLDKEDWDPPSNININEMKPYWEKMVAEKVPYADSVSYHNMCRFYSRSFFDHPLSLKYKYYWRLEPGVEFHCDIEEDPFDALEKGGQVYGFAITLNEFMQTIPTLEITIDRAIAQGRLPRAITADRMEFMFTGNKYNGCHFWSNFEIANFQLFRTDLYRAFINELEKSGGFYKERWGDAPVHSIFLAKYYEKSKIHFFKDIGYTHNPFTHCPKKCKNSTCTRKKNFDFDAFSCLRPFLANKNELHSYEPN